MWTIWRSRTKDLFGKLWSSQLEASGQREGQGQGEEHSCGGTQGSQ